MSRHGSWICQSSRGGTKQGVREDGSKVQTVKKESTRSKKEDFESLSVGSVSDIDSILNKYNMKKALINLCWEGSLWVREVMYETKAV